MLLIIIHTKKREHGMHIFRCTNGHQNAIDFKDSLSQPCPNCGLTVWKFRDSVGTVDGKNIGPETVTLVVKKPIDKKFILLGIGVIIVAIGATAYSNSVANVSIKKKTELVLPISKMSAPEKVHDITNVEITDLNVIQKDNSIASISFILKSKDGTEVDFPKLILEWKNTNEEKTTLQPKDYTAEPGKLVTAEVNIEISKPVDATGIDIQIVY